MEFGAVTVGKFGKLVEFMVGTGSGDVRLGFDEFKNNGLC